MEDHTQTPLAPVANMVSLGGWSNLSAWAANMTTRYAPSLEDLVWVGPRILGKLGSFMAHGSHGDFAPDADADAGLLSTSAAYIYDIVDSTASLTDHAAAPAPATGIRLSFESARSFGSILTYATSRWAMACIAMALILNRTHIFAATRRRLLLNWKLRLLLRFLPIILLVTQIRHLLMAMQCQTSAIFPELRWGDYSKHSRLLYAYPNKFINTFSSALLFGATDEQSCSAARMIPVQNQIAANQLHGSLSLLWPLFGTFCLSQFIETVSCAVQGRTLSAETGMTLFEQSLAFAEANQLGHLNFEIISKSATTEASSTTRAALNLFTKSMIMKRVNTPPEVLLVSFLSAMTHLTSHLLGLFNLQSKYRLLNTGFWGLCFMGSLVWSACSFDLENSASQGFLRFPTVCIIGFVPHVLVLGGIILCLTIYSLALLLSALATPPNQERSSMTFRQRIIYAHENMQANVSFSEVRITRDMDFYTALLRTGFAAISMASEAVYLNEDRGVNLKRHTWLEEERYREAEELQKQWIGLGHASSKYDHIGAIGLIPVKDGPVLAPNGYARERAAQKVANSRAERSFRAGMGATDRGSRWVMALEFFLGIFKLACRVSALVTLWLLRLVRVKRQPGWLVRLAERPKTTTSTREEINQAAPANQMAGRNLGVIRNGRLPISDGIDVEAELRRIGQNVDEENLDKDLYNYFLENGWWGSGDCSGDYVPSHADDDEWDATSVVSVATTNTTDEKDGLKDTNAWEPDDDEEEDGDAGQRTPTQSRSRMTRENTPVADSPMGMTDLARLLRPANREERDEATALAAHLVCDGVMTRARFRRLEQLRRTSVLTSPRRRLDATTKTIPTTSVTPAIVTPAMSAPAVATTSRPIAMRDVRTKLDADEEEVLLEQLLISRRQDLAAAPSQQQQQQQQQPRTPTTRNTTVEATGSAHAFASSEEGQEGPRCVVCQSAARTIIVWPCRCLSLCDDCRVSLAMNNFDKCVCCRRDVLSFSRIYVP